MKILFRILALPLLFALIIAVIVVGVPAAIFWFVVNGITDAVDWWTSYARGESD
jgi:hypothetical protein